jgi:type I restriction enzyme R subunit
MDFVLGLEDGKNRYIKAVSELGKAFALVSSMDEAIAIRDEVGFFQAIKVALSKHTTRDNRSPEDLDTAVRQIVSKAVASDGVIDIFAAAGMNNPDISILSDGFLEEVRALPQKNLALEVLRKLLNDEIKTRSHKNLVQSRTFSEMLENTIKRYQNRSIEAAQVIAELIELAKEIRQAQARGENLGSFSNRSGETCCVWRNCSRSWCMVFSGLRDRAVRSNSIELIRSCSWRTLHRSSWAISI